MKVLGTNIGLPSEYFNKMEELCNRKFYHNQFRIICKCKSLADANKKCKTAGLHDKVFVSGWYSETGNKIELELCEKEDIWISKDGTGCGREYISISELQ